MKSIIVDSKEPTSVKSLSFGDDAAKTIAPLSYGDFWIITDGGKMLVIERKTASDFIGSLKSGRVFDQVHRMINGVGDCYLLITGSFLASKNGTSIFDEKRKEWIEYKIRFESVQGALLKIQNQGCPIYYAADSADLVPSLHRLCRHADIEKYTIKPAKPSHVFSKSELYLSGLAGIGEKRAMELMNVFESAGVALHFLTDLHTDHEEISGIGKKTKQNIINHLGGRMIFEPNYLDPH